VALMNAILGARTRAEWIDAFEQAGVPVGAVQSIGEALAHPQTLARGMVLENTHPQAGATKTLGCPIHFSATPTRVSRAAPMLGEHTRELLREYGYSATEIASLEATRVVESINAVAFGPVSGGA